LKLIGWLGLEISIALILYHPVDASLAEGGRIVFEACTIIRVPRYRRPIGAVAVSTTVCDHGFVDRRGVAN